MSLICCFKNCKQEATHIYFKKVYCKEHAVMVKLFKKAKREK